MEFFLPENLTSDRTKAVNELLQGRDFANQLKLVLDTPERNDGCFSYEDLATKVFNSFVNTLSILDRVDSEEVISQLLPTSSTCSKERKSEDSGESSKSSPGMDRRGRYKRRKTLHSWTQDTTTLTGDGYAWRKYGQKPIQNAKYPRHYYRCTHKYDQGCQATKQVQRLEEELYRSTYCGHHTCKGFLKASELVLDSSDADSTVFLSFDHAAGVHLPNKPDGSFFTSFQSVKQESTRVDASRDLTHHQNPSTSDYLVSADLSASEQPDVLSGFNYCSPGGDSLDLLVAGYIGFDDDILQSE